MAIEKQGKYRGIIVRVWCQKPTCSNELGSSESLPLCTLLYEQIPIPVDQLSTLFSENIDNSAIKRYSIYYSISLNGV